MRLIVVRTTRINKAAKSSTQRKMQTITTFRVADPKFLHTGTQKATFRNHFFHKNDFRTL